MEGGRGSHMARWSKHFEGIRLVGGGRVLENASTERSGLQAVGAALCFLAVLQRQEHLICGAAVGEQSRHASVPVQPKSKPSLTLQVVLCASESPVNEYSRILILGSQTEDSRREEDGRKFMQCVRPERKAV